MYYDLLVSDATKLGAAASLVFMFFVLFLRIVLGLSLVEVLLGFFVLAAPVMAAIAFVQITEIFDPNFGLGDDSRPLCEYFQSKRECLGDDHAFPLKIDRNMLKPAKSNFKQFP